MEVYDSEREQFDVLKTWWQQNGKAIVIGSILGIGTLVGWQQWQSGKQESSEAASQEYGVLLDNMEKQNLQGVKERGATIMNNFAKTPYAALAALAVAKVNVEEGDIASARIHLQKVVDQKDQLQFQHVARLRLARLILDEGEAKQALDLVKSVDVAGFASAYDELKGDIHAALGNTAEARSAYERAIAAMDAALDQSIIKMKLDDLGETEVTL